MSAEFSWLAVVCSDLVNELLPDLGVAGDNDGAARHLQSPRAQIDTLNDTRANWFTRSFRFCRPPLLISLEEDERPDHEVLAAGSVLRRGRVDARSVERPSRDGTIRDGVVAFEHRDLVRLLLGKPVPLVFGAALPATSLPEELVEGRGRQ